EQQTHNLLVVGSSPTGPINLLAQQHLRRAAAIVSSCRPATGLQKSSRKTGVAGPGAIDPGSSAYRCSALRSADAATCARRCSVRIAPTTETNVANRATTS